MKKPIPPTLLIVEDDDGLRNQLRWTFDHYDVLEAGNRAEALGSVEKHHPTVVTLDLGLPPDPTNASEGLAALEQIRVQAPHTKVIVVTGNDDHQIALQAIAEGAYDYCQKPVDIEVLKLIVDRAFYLASLEQENRELAIAARQGGPLGAIIGTSPQVTDVLNTTKKVAASDASILILGESGTGKELIAQTIHSLSDRSDGPFVAINCAAIPADLLESELFGHEKGAFTGAVKTTVGKIEQAINGTLFLDEIGDMPHPLQAKILRFLEQRVIERVGGREPIKTDVRIVCATHQNLKALIEQQLFREDLYYRIGEIELAIPPLRERTGDTAVLTKAFLQQFAAEANHGKPKAITAEALDVISRYPWPGNIRELKNTIKRAMILCENDTITVNDLALNVTEEDEPDNVAKTLKEVRDRAERSAINNALAAHNGKITAAAASLDITRPTLYTLMEKLDIKR